MAFDAAQILRQTYAAGAEAAQFRDLAEPQRVAEPAVQRGEIAGTAFVVEERSASSARCRGRVPRSCAPWSRGWR